MINGYYVNAFETMGMAHFDNVECVYDGATPLTAMMYNVRYVLTNSKNTMVDIIRYIAVRYIAYMRRMSWLTGDL